MSNEAFEKWLKENYLVDMSEFIVDEQERTYIKENNLLRKAWQAAKADSEQEIAELKSHINNLREALQRIKASKTARYEVEADVGGEVFDVLETTPAQSLQEHDNEVIERCARVCDEHGAIWVAKSIRALKG